MRRPDGVTIIAIYHFVTAIPSLIGTCAILLFAIFPTVRGARDEYGLLAALFGLIIAIFATAGWTVFSIAAGWGLLGLKEWARWLTIALAVISLLVIPIGTIIGGLIIWYLLKEEVRAVFLEDRATGSPAIEP